MRIRFQPQDKNHPSDKRINTNLGEWFPGDERTLMPEQDVEGARLVANGDFVDVNAEAPAPAVVGDVENDIAGEPGSGKTTDGDDKTSDTNASVAVADDSAQTIEEKVEAKANGKKK